MSEDKNARKDLSMRFSTAILEKVDKRIEIVNARRKRDGESQVSRTQWFENMAIWVCDELPHQAVRADLIKAWPGLPEEALGVEK